MQEMREDMLLVSAPYIQTKLEVHYIVAVGGAEIVYEMFRILNRRKEIKYFHHIACLIDKDRMYDGYCKHLGMEKSNSYDIFLGNSIIVDLDGEEIRVDKDWIKAKGEILGIKKM